MAWAAPAKAEDIRSGFRAAVELNAELRGCVEAQTVQLDARIAEALITLAALVREACWNCAPANAERETAQARVAAARAL